MAPKRPSKSDKGRGSGKRARGSGDAGPEQGRGVQVSEGITERQLASFSEVSEGVNSSRILQAQKDLAISSSHAGLNSLLAAAGAQATPAAPTPNVLGEYSAAIQLFQLQQQGSVGHAFPAGFAPHALSAVPPAGIPMPIGHVRDITGVGLGQAGPFGQNALQSLLTAQMAVQNSATNVLQLPQYALHPGAGALPSMVTLNSQGKSALSTATQPAVSPFNPPTSNSTVHGVSVEGVYDQKHTSTAGGSSSASLVAARLEAKHDSAARSHGPSADRYSLLMTQGFVGTSMEYDDDLPCHDSVASEHERRKDICRANIRLTQASRIRYKNRWSEEEITALKKGVTRFEKKHKKRSEDGSNASPKGRPDVGKKGDTEQMWEYILTS